MLCSIGRLKPEKFRLMVKNKSRIDCYGYAQGVSRSVRMRVSCILKAHFIGGAYNIRRRQTLYFVHHQGFSQDLKRGQVEMEACVFYFVGIQQIIF